MIAVTSATSGEGKSTICFNLALTMAEFDKKILLIECDMRRGVLGRRYNIGDEIENGISNLLSGNCCLEDALYKLSDERGNSFIHLIPNGECPPNPTELLAGERMVQLLKEQRENYDYILLDCPPIGLVADTNALLAYCDASIFVIASGTVSKKLAKHTIEEIEKTGCSIIGVVLNKIDGGSVENYRNYYGYGKYYYQYGYYDHKDRPKYFYLRYVSEWKNLCLMVGILILLIANARLYFGERLSLTDKKIEVESTTEAKTTETTVEEKKLPQEELIDNLDAVKVTYLFEDISEQMYEDIYCELNNNGISGVLSLRNGFLPKPDRDEEDKEELLNTDSDKQLSITKDEYSLLIDGGWSGVISIGLSSEKNFKTWKKEVQSYSRNIESEIGKKPTVYYFKYGEYRPECEEVLKSIGIQKILISSENIDEIKGDGFTVVPVFEIESTEDVPNLKKLVWRYPGVVILLKENIMDITEAVAKQDGLDKERLFQIFKIVNEKGEERAALFED